MAAKPGKIDWLRLERRIREALRNLQADCDGHWDALKREDLSATLFLIDSILGDETGRGYSLDWVTEEEVCDGTVETYLAQCDSEE